MTNGQTFHFIPHIGINVWQTDRHLISPLILYSVIQTDKLRFISPSNWNLHKTDGQTTFHFIPHVEIQVRQTDELSFISPLISGSKANRRTTYIKLFDPSYWNPSKTDIRTNYVSFHHSNWNLRKTNIRTNYVSFHPSYWNLRQTDRQTTFHLTPHIGIKVRQTEEGFVLPSCYDLR